MMGRTHMAFGFLAASLLSPYVSGDKVAFFALAVFGALLPDIDHEGSKINNMFKVTKIVPIFFKHRGFFHSIFPPIIMYGAMSAFHYSFWGLSLAIGYFAHLFSDSLTKLGVNFLYPLTSFKLKGPLTTDSWQEHALSAAVIILGAVFIFY